MANCSFCNTYILFGGVKEDDLTFCNAKCHEQGHLARSAIRLPRQNVKAVLDEVHQGRCPKCGGNGPVDVHVSHSVWSAVYLTSWNSKPQICCRSCGVKSQFGGIAFCAVLGWWGFPFGLIMTPIQICRNIGGMISGPNPEEPSSELERIVRLGIVAGDFGGVRSIRKSRRSDPDDFEDDEIIEDAFESEADDDEGYDDVEVVTKTPPKRRAISPREPIDAEDVGISPTRSGIKRQTSSSASAASDDCVTCPSCEASFKATPAVRGKRVKCPKCSGIIDVPE